MKSPSKEDCIDYTKNYFPSPKNLTPFLADGVWKGEKWESDFYAKEERDYLANQKHFYENHIDWKEEQLFALLDNKKKIQYYEALFRKTNKEKK